MSENTKIEWADHTFNPWIGCTKVGPGCDNCYAKADFDDRRHRVVWGAGQPRIRTKTWGDPVKWNKQADAFFAEHGRRQRVFCASLADVFDNEVDQQWRNDLFRLISETPNLDWLMLTKRIGNVVSMLDDALLQSPRLRSGPCRAASWPWLNVWLGITVCNQIEADRDIPKLLAIPAAKRFLSMEPLLGRVDLCESLGMWWNQTMGCFESEGLNFNRKGCDGSIGVDWVIVGGESGPDARPMHPDWARSLRDQCQAAGVPFLFKQWGEWKPIDGPKVGAAFGQGRLPFSFLEKWIFPNGETHHRSLELTTNLSVYNTYIMGKVGKKPAGRVLDSREWNGAPS